MPASTPWRPQPPSISDPPEGDSDPWEPGEEGEDGGMQIGDVASDGKPEIGRAHV